MECQSWSSEAAVQSCQATKTLSGGLQRGRFQNLKGVFIIKWGRRAALVGSQGHRAAPGVQDFNPFQASKRDEGREDWS